MITTHSTITVPLVGGAPLVEATFVARPNRFLVEARLAAEGVPGATVAAHLADRGRLLTKLVPGARLVLGHKPGAGRKTQYQVAGVYGDGQLISLDTHLPNRLIEAALRAGALEPFATYGYVEREVAVGGSRFDFGLAPQPPAGGKRGRLLDGGASPCLVEVKSVGDIEGDLAVFPDAPTARGRRHLLELAHLAEAGVRTAVVFVVQRGDGTAGPLAGVAVNRAIDPEFADALAEVAGRGVELYAYKCPLTPDGIALGNGLPVLTGR